MNTVRFQALAAALGLLAVASSMSPLAAAAEADGVLTETVRFSDLNLDSSDGVRELYSRLRAAARTVCEPLEPVGTRIPSAAWRDCLDQAIADAVRRVDRPLLTAYHQHRERPLATLRRADPAARG